MRAAVPAFQGVSRLQDYDLLMYLLNTCLCCPASVTGDKALGSSVVSVTRAVLVKRSSSVYSSVIKCDAE